MASETRLDRAGVRRQAFKGPVAPGGATLLFAGRGA